ncbi:hypothetical protein SNOG_09576 [Parastagonospora nodorum SN15]|uniref:Uncharacterized protein n=1 Tax=Phaeosphaeria nodorum (strain SN15 / ATCC MYA-4574 / FGSC 10173) TaxID=321614 RepID=Q0UF88_PHANO|nr:hypothetical protein SNOG_09576 [Parastagonospora nodorum SN15]EAT82841.1 hypothetical protein SNOG_09576 [Parastagonospora nodorum SN15]
MTQAWGTLTQSKPAARLRERAHRLYPYASNEARCSSRAANRSSANTSDQIGPIIDAGYNAANHGRPFDPAKHWHI